MALRSVGNNRALVNAQRAQISNQYGFTGRLVRASFFKYSHESGGVRNWIVQKLTGTTPPLDLARLETTKKHFAALGAEFSEIEAVEALIPLFTLSASDLKEKIEALGGSWESRQVEKKHVFAIITPKNPSPEWQTLYTPLHALFEEEALNDNGETVLITARHVEGSIEDRQDHCIFFANMAEPWQLRKKRLAYFLGRGFSLSTYNGRGMLDQNGMISIEGSYKDADAVYQKVKEKFPTVYIYGNCKDAFAAMYTAKKNAENAIFETPPRSIVDAVHHHAPGFVQSKAIASLGALYAPNNSCLKDLCKDTSRGDLKGIIEEFSLSEKDHHLIFLANSGDHESPLAEIQDVADKASQDPHCHTTTLVVDTSLYPEIEPHKVQSWQDVATINSIEKTMGII